MPGRTLKVALPVGVLMAVGVLSFLQVARTAPAFSPGLRAESVLGDWRLAQGDTHYNVGDYYFQLGYGYLHADTAALLLGSETMPDAEAFDAQMQRSIGLLSRSLTHAPGRASAWTSLAWASIFDDDLEAAEQALRTSWQLAPHNVAEAPDRTALVALMDEFRTPAAWRDAFVDAASERDLQVLERHDRSYLDAFVNDPGLLPE